MKTVKEMVAELEASKSKYVTYGESDLGIPILREDAIDDIKEMDDEQIGKGTWYECDENGNADMEIPVTETLNNLDELFTAMKSGELDGIDWSCLPAFGGPAPVDTREIWSWDATRMIVGTCSDDIKIVNR